MQHLTESEILAINAALIAFIPKAKGAVKESARTAFMYVQCIINHQKEANERALMLADKQAELAEHNQFWASGE